MNYKPLTDEELGLLDYHKSLRYTKENAARLHEQARRANRLAEIVGAPFFDPEQDHQDNMRLRDALAAYRGYK